MKSILAELEMIVIRAETEEDRDAIHRINEMAFGCSNEGDLVNALRENVRPYISLVAVIDEKLVGHIFFSPVSVESVSGVFTAMGLAPMAVLPEYQGHGIGTLLVNNGLKESLRIGYDVVVVVGHENYYPRFGFTPARSKGLRCEYDVPEDVFMVAELRPGALEGRGGLVKYPPEFNSI